MLGSGREEWLDFQALVQEMYDTPDVGEGNLVVYSGKVTEIALEAFLKAWALPRPDMPWSLWLWTDAIKLDYLASAPTDLAYLERGHVFGEGGELALRRDGAYFRWSFVGTAALPEKISTQECFSPRSYWRDHPDLQLRPYERSALLWGEYISETGLKRYQARVGRADLTYPTLEKQWRVQVHYREYLDADNVVLVWHWGLDGASKE